ncbi:MAG: MurR/RpiR family transcriptional regulator [Mycoplasmatales bacterium]
MKRLFHKKMTDSEHHIANIILNNYAEICDMTITDFSALSNVSNAMITKYAKNCGFDGYKELRYYIKSENITPEQNDYEIKEKILKYFDSFDTSIIQKVREEIIQVDSILLFGKGTSYSLCEFMVPRLRASFKKSVISENNNIEIQNELLMPGKKILFIISASGNVDKFREIIRSAKEKGIKVIIISEINIPNISSKCDIYINLLPDSFSLDPNIVRGRTLFFIFFETLVQSNYINN